MSYRCLPRHSIEVLNQILELLFGREREVPSLELKIRS
jgi:hypothetical protein